MITDTCTQTCNKVFTFIAVIIVHCTRRIFTKRKQVREDIAAHEYDSHVPVITDIFEINSTGIRVKYLPKAFQLFGFAAKSWAIFRNISPEKFKQTKSDITSLTTGSKFKS